MKIEEVMSRDVVTVTPDASLKAVAGILIERGISGLPVCDAEGRVLGVVSEGDLLFKEQGRDLRRGALFGRMAAEAKSDARTAGDAMSAPPIVIEPRRPVSEAARLMLQHQVKRLPVISEGRLVGIVTRADLVRAFHRPDADVEHELRDDVMQRVLWIDPDRVSVAVDEGEVRLSGKLDTKTEAELLEAYATAVPGVVGVDSELTWSVDDQARRSRNARLPHRV
jgi:CBS domain-containing protein